MANHLLQCLRWVIAWTEYIWHRALAFLLAQLVIKLQYVVSARLECWTSRRSTSPTSNAINFKDISPKIFDISHAILSLAWNIFPTASQRREVHVPCLSFSLLECLRFSTHPSISIGTCKSKDSTWQSAFANPTVVRHRGFFLCCHPWCPPHGGNCDCLRCTASDLRFST